MYCLVGNLHRRSIFRTERPQNQNECQEHTSKHARHRITQKVFSGQAAAFLGIPDAQLPVGNLRWHEPLPPKPWDSVRDALPSAHRGPNTLTANNDAAARVSQEDYLYLNVWTPEWPPKSELPVLFWIRGRDNNAGITDGIGADGSVLASHGSYYSSLDQIAALRWVRENITQFGSDPERVTNAGQSAGALDAGILMTSPLAAGLFIIPPCEAELRRAIGRFYRDLAPAELQLYGFDGAPPLL